MPVDFLTAIVVVTSSFGTFAHAADLGSLPSQAPAQTWTGFSLGVGGGIGSLNADVNSKASRTDGVGCAPNSNGCPPDVVLREIDQDYNSHLGDLGGTGGFFTLQGAYDYQFAPRWVGGAFVDADWSNTSANAKQTSNSSVSFVCPSGDCSDDPAGSFSSSNGTIRTKVSTDWNVSVGGRIGWLPNPDTLLYFLAAYTHADLGDAKVNVNIPDPSDLISVVLGGSPGNSPFPNNPTSLSVKLPELDSTGGVSAGVERQELVAPGQ